ncbi:hypothetical protein [Rothia halotolerans]|uniref:hypothetical protein n=1 Tax=Rothia halotolerans TaxID=405770 RepID=UPI00101DAF8B|nr:hypothetical protein [Rothia halotolerans]
MAQFPKRSRSQVTLAFLGTLIVGSAVVAWITIQSGTPHLWVYAALVVFVILVVLAVVWLAKDKPEHGERGPGSRH